MSDLINKQLFILFDYNAQKLTTLVEKGRQLTGIESHKIFKHSFRTIEKGVVRNRLKLTSPTMPASDFSQIFFDAYELIYYRYFNFDLLTYFEYMVKIFKNEIDASVFDGLGNFGFEIHSLQWLGFQLAHNVDFEEMTSGVLEQVTCKALQCALNNIFVMLELDNDVDDKVNLVKLSTTLKTQFKNLTRLRDFRTIGSTVQTLKPVASLPTIISEANQEDLYKITIYLYIEKFNNIINMMIKHRMV